MTNISVLQILTFIRPYIPKKNVTTAAGLYLPEIREMMQFDEPRLKTALTKLGGNPKITIDFQGRRKGGIEIPRSIINPDILNLFDKRKY